jgi:hypothetical protein
MRSTRNYRAVAAITAIGIMAIVAGLGGLLNNHFRVSGEYYLYREDAVLELLLPLLAVQYVAGSLAVSIGLRRR